MKIAGWFRCRVCTAPRPLNDLLRVRSVAAQREQPFYVCRPGVEGNNPACFRRGTCFNGHHTIEVAV